MMNLAAPPILTSAPVFTPGHGKACVFGESLVWQYDSIVTELYQKNRETCLPSESLPCCFLCFSCIYLFNISGYMRSL